MMVFSNSPDEPERWARLLREVLDAERLWTVEELGAVWKHELSAPMQFDALEFPSPVNGARKGEHTQERASIGSFRELFLHPAPPLRLLVKTKEFAKANRKRTSGLLPPEICTVLYLAAIVTAQVRLHMRITRLHAAKVQSGVEWALAQDWLDQLTKDLFREWIGQRTQ